MSRCYIVSHRRLATPDSDNSYSAKTSSFTVKNATIHGLHEHSRMHTRTLYEYSEELRARLYHLLDVVYVLHCLYVLYVSSESIIPLLHEPLSKLLVCGLDVHTSGTPMQEPPRAL